jgi:hypothetical protein
MNKKIATLALTVALSLSGAALAQMQPMDNVGHRHPNLDAAQHLSSQAFERLVASQKANEFDEGGHAQRAKDLLEQANAEMAQAAQFLNTHGHK